VYLQALPSVFHHVRSTKRGTMRSRAALPSSQLPAQPLHPPPMCFAGLISAHGSRSGKKKRPGFITGPLSFAVLPWDAACCVVEALP